MRVRRHVNRRRGDGRRKKYTGEAQTTAQRGKHTGRQEANPIDAPGSSQEWMSSQWLARRVRGFTRAERYRNSSYESYRRRGNSTVDQTLTERGTVGRRSQHMCPYVAREGRRERARLADRRPLEIAVADLARRRHSTVATPASVTGHHRTGAAGVRKMTVGPEDPGQVRRRDVKGSEGRRSFGRPLARAARFVPTAVGGASAEL